MIKRLGRATQGGKAIIAGDFELKTKVKGDIKQRFQLINVVNNVNRHLSFPQTCLHF